MAPNRKPARAGCASAASNLVSLSSELATIVAVS
jgi:hypothetical protein